MLKENIESVNQDLLIQNHYLHSNTGLFTQRPNLFNAQRLMQALKKRNQVYNQHQDVKFLPPLPEVIKEQNIRVVRQAKINSYHREKQTIKDQLERQWNNQLQWEKFTFANQEQYVDQHQQYLIHSMIGCSFKGTTDIQKTVKGMLMNNLKKIKDRESTARSMIRIQNDEQTNKIKYLDFVKRKVLANQDKIKSIDEFEFLDGEISRFWRILSEYFKSYEFGTKYEKPNPELTMVYSSIALIQAQFKEELLCLDSEKEVSEFMRKRCILSSKDNNFVINQEGILVWSIPYAYYRAGDMSRFYISLNDRGEKGAALREEFSNFHDSLSSFYPTAQRFAEEQTNDLFYNQLVSIAKGYSLFDERLCKMGSLDFIWLTLKCLKIYEGTNKTKKLEMQQVIEALQAYFLLNQDRYQTKEASLIPYLQFLYLGSFESIITLKKKQKISLGLTEDDYLHFLLALSSRPEIVGQPQYQSIMKALEEELTSYISILLGYKEYKEYAIFYLLQIPPENFKNVILSSFNSWERFTEVNHCFVDGFNGWKYVKFRYSFNLMSELFEDSILHLLKNLLQIEQKPEVQIKIIHSARQLLSSIQNFMDMVLQCQCNHLLKLQHFKQVKRSLASQPQKDHESKVIYRKLNGILEEAAEKSEVVKQEYGWLIKFLEDYCKLEDIILEKNVQKLENFIKNEDYVKNLPSLLSQQQNQNKQIFEKLAKFNALELFFIYLKNIVHSFEKIFYMRGNQGSLRTYKEQLSQYLRKIQNQGIYNVNRFKSYFDF